MVGLCPGTSIPSASQAIEALRHPPWICEISHRETDQADLAELTAIITPANRGTRPGPAGQDPFSNPVSNPSDSSYNGTLIGTATSNLQTNVILLTVNARL
jgi:hypothetical protein